MSVKNKKILAKNFASTKTLTIIGRHPRVSSDVVFVAVKVFLDCTVCGIQCKPLRLATVDLVYVFKKHLSK